MVFFGWLDFVVRFYEEIDRLIDIICLLNIPKASIDNDRAGARLQKLTPAQQKQTLYVGENRRPGVRAPDFCTVVKYES
jgi:hypothetical protein